MRKNPSTGFIQSEIIDIIQSIIYNFQSNIYLSLFSPLAAVVPLDQQPSIKCYLFILCSLSKCLCTHIEIQLTVFLYLPWPSESNSSKPFVLFVPKCFSTSLITFCPELNICCRTPLFQIIPLWPPSPP